jgi:3-oxoacyl-[acyl-carrier-protein] synthase-1
MNRPVFITQTGLLCARGTSPADVASALWLGECSAGLCQIGERNLPYFGLPLDEASWLLRAEQSIRQLAGQLGQISDTTPLFIASSSFQIGHFEQLGAPFELPQAAASFSQKIAEWMGLAGARFSFSNACISGFSALDAARSLIAAGLIDDAVVLGVELANNSTLAGFAAMELLSSSAGRPFDARRDGMVLGEAVAVVHLGARPASWRIAALSTGLDGHSTTGPNPDGSRIAEIVLNCLNEAQLQAADIELIKLQAAGSPGTDLAEANALRSVFGQRIPPLLSMKPALGHTLGASGIAELAALLACLDADKLPATAGFARVDPEIALFPMVERSTAHIERALLNLIGFGGGLASLIVTRHR